MADNKRWKIIIVDDDDFLVDMYSRKFGENGAEIIVCKSGAELLEKLKNGEKADLILLDIVLPELDGLETLERVRQEKLAENIPIVMLTNQSEEKDIVQSKKLGVAGYIVKASATPSAVVAQTLKIIQDFK